MALYSSFRISGPPIANSEAIFVHNNSKHGRRTPAFGREAAVVGDGEPVLHFEIKIRAMHAVHREGKNNTFTCCHCILCACRQALHYHSVSS